MGQALTVSIESQDVDDVVAVGQHGHNEGERPQHLAMKAPLALSHMADHLPVDVDL